LGHSCGWRALRICWFAFCYWLYLVICFGTFNTNDCWLNLSICVIMVPNNHNRFSSFLGFWLYWSVIKPNLASTLHGRLRCRIPRLWVSLSTRNEWRSDCSSVDVMAIYASNWINFQFTSLIKFNYCHSPRAHIIGKCIV